MVEIAQTLDLFLSVESYKSDSVWVNGWRITNDMVFESLGSSTVGIIFSFNISCLGRLECLLLSDGISSSLSLYLVGFVRFIVLFLSCTNGPFLILVDTSNNCTIFELFHAVIHVVGTIKFVPVVFLPLGFRCLHFNNTVLFINQLISS